MSVDVTQIVTIGGIVAVSCGIICLLTVSSNKYDKIVSVIKEVTEDVKRVITTAKPVIDIADKIAPNNPVVNVAEIVEKWAGKGVGGVEQLFNSGQLNSDKRNELATNAVYTALSLYGIIPDDQLKQLISITIEDFVDKLGHKEKATEASVGNKEISQSVSSENIIIASNDSIDNNQAAPVQESTEDKVNKLAILQQIKELTAKLELP